MTSNTGIPRFIHYATPTHEIFLFKLQILKKFVKFAELNRKLKIPVYLPYYFCGQKGVPEKYLHMVVKINPVYWLKRNQHVEGYKITADNCFKFCE